MSCVEAVLEPGRKRLNESAVLTDRQPPEVLAIFVKDDSMSLSEVKSQVRHFLATMCSVHLEESTEAASEE